MLTQQDVIWAYKVLFERMPENSAVMEEKMGCGDMKTLRDSLMASTEFKEKSKEAGNSIVMVEDTDGDRFWIDLNDQFIGRGILQGKYEPHVLNLMKKWIQPGTHVLDIGANVGYFSIKMARMVGSKGTVLSYEPMPHVYSLLDRTVRENLRRDHPDMGDVCCLNEAVGASESKLNLIYAPDTINHGGAYLAELGTEPPPNHTAATVQVYPLDALQIEDQGQGVSFIKMDVEGAEPLVIEGGRQFLKRHKYPPIITEVHRDQLRKVSNCSPNQYMNMLRDLGYKPLAITGDNEMQAIGDLPDNRPFQIDVFAVRP